MNVSSQNARSILLAMTMGLSLILAWPVAAQDFQEYFLPDINTETPLSHEQLQSAFSGKTHNGTYSFLRPDITTYGFSETTFKDGRILHVQQTHDKILKDTGDWEIIEDVICYDYDDPRLRQACFQIYPVGNCYYHYQVEVQGFPASGFTARSVIKGDTANCDPAIS